MFLCFYFPSVFAQLLHLCMAEYLLLLHPEVFGAVNLAVLRVYPQGSGSTEYSCTPFHSTFLVSSTKQFDLSTSSTGLRCFVRFR